MSGLEIFYVILAIYIVGLGLGVAFAYADVDGPNTSGWVKIIFGQLLYQYFYLELYYGYQFWYQDNYLTD